MAIKTKAASQALHKKDISNASFCDWKKNKLQRENVEIFREKVKRINYF